MKIEEIGDANIRVECFKDFSAEIEQDEESVRFLGIQEVEIDIERNDDYIDEFRESSPKSQEGITFLHITDVPDPEPQSTDEDEKFSAEKQPDADLSVFLVEDDKIISNIVRHLMKKQGYEIHQAKDGKKAIEMIDELPPPNLAILDIMLPYVDGFELIKRIRESENWKDVPILMLTSKSQEEDIARAFTAGANDYVAKPFQSKELLARVDRLSK
ncbi:MAG: response regulator [Pyrinomonadaceae bacterium]|nr:response regulator [Pyrinomonadaceae bacterium]